MLGRNGPKQARPDRAGVEPKRSGIKIPKRVHEPGNEHMKLLSSVFPSEAKPLLTAKGVDMIETLGADALRGLLKNVFSGKNIRDSTEFLTRQRISALNHALLQMFVAGKSRDREFIGRLPELATNTLLTKGVGKDDKWLALWVLGLTDKAFQNVLRDSASALTGYRDRYAEVCGGLAERAALDYGSLTGTVSVGSNTVPLDWPFFSALMNTIGAQTVAIRGSEKSKHGKFFEKLILGALLSMLGFRFSQSKKVAERTFWLSSRGEKRESDATLLFGKGQGIRFDIGFIGRGNSEITLDKVSRFERHAEFGTTQYFMATIVIVDRLGEDSQVVEQARAISADVVQMSASFWVKEVAQVISRTIKEFDHPLLGLPDHEIDAYLTAALRDIDVMEFVKASLGDSADDEGDDDLA